MRVVSDASLCHLTDVWACADMPEIAAKAMMPLQMAALTEKCFTVALLYILRCDVSLMYVL